MTFSEKLNQIENQIEKIKTVNANVLRSNEISTLESDLVREHLRTLYDLYNDLAKINNNTFVANESKNEDNESIEEVVNEEKCEAQNSSVNEILETTSSIKKEEESKVEEVEEPAIELPKIEQDNTKVVVQEIVKDDSSTSQPVVQEDNEGMSLFEKYQDNSPQEINVKTNTLKPLKQLISLNDKFIIIKELFNNEISKYDAMLVSVDQMKSKKEAMNYMQQNVWNSEELQSKEEVIERVEHILDRKFATLS